MLDFETTFCLTKHKDQHFNQHFSDGVSRHFIISFHRTYINAIWYSLNEEGSRYHAVDES